MSKFESGDSIPKIPDVAEFDNAIQKYLDRMASLRFADASIALIYFSDTWPPTVEMTMAEGAVHDYFLRLSGFPDGHLAVTLERDDGTPSFRTEFQRVVLSESSSFIVFISVRDERVELKFGGSLGTYCPEQEPLKIQGAVRGSDG